MISEMHPMSVLYIIYSTQGLARSRMSKTNWIWVFISRRWTITICFICTCLGYSVCYHRIIAWTSFACMGQVVIILARGTAARRTCKAWRFVDHQAEYNYHQCRHMTIIFWICSHQLLNILSLSYYQFKSYSKTADISPQNKYKRIAHLLQ